MTVLGRVAREPVLVGAAVLATLQAQFPDMSAGWKLAAGAWVALLQRAFSTPKASADERVEAAKYVGAVEHQAIAASGQAIATARPLRASSTAAPATGGAGMPTA